MKLSFPDIYISIGKLVTIMGNCLGNEKEPAKEEYDSLPTQKKKGLAEKWLNLLEVSKVKYFPDKRQN